MAATGRSSAESSTSQVVGAALFRKGLRLYDYQVDSRDKIIAAENAGRFAVAMGRIPLTEPFGSGKTFIILGLILESPLPPIGACYLYEHLPSGLYYNHAAGYHGGKAPVCH